MTKSVRDNPPASVVSFVEQDRYRTLYDDITGNGCVMQYVDRHALGELAVTMCQMDELRRDVNEKGTSMEVDGDRAVVTKRNPSVDALLKLYPIVMKLMNEFKMSPNSRGKGITGPGETGSTKGDNWGAV